MSFDDPQARFRRLFELAERDILAYALRRVGRADDAADVVAETFLVAWRRLEEVPAGDGARLWLYGVARRQLANQRRGDLRRSALADRLRDALISSATEATEHTQSDRVAVVSAAPGRLSEEDRELLTLSSWEGLSPGELAVVMGIPAVTLRSRLHRARRRLRAQLDHDEAAGASPCPPTASLERTET